MRHLTLRVARSVFPRREPTPDPQHSGLLKTLRLAVLDAAAAADVDLITTLAYSGAVDHAFVAAMAATVTAHHGRMRWVQLTAPDQVLLDRVRSADRSACGKLDDPDRLRQVLAARDMHARVPYPDVCTIDTTTTTPHHAADTITAWLAAPC